MLGFLQDRLRAAAGAGTAPKLKITMLEEHQVGGYLRAIDEIGIAVEKADSGQVVVIPFSSIIVIALV